MTSSRELKEAADGREGEEEVEEAEEVAEEVDGVGGCSLLRPLPRARSCADGLTLTRTPTGPQP